MVAACFDNKIFLYSSTKHAVISSILLFLQHNHYIDISEQMLICLIVVVGAVIQISMLCLDMKDPYEVFEKLACSVLIQLPDKLVAKTEKKKTE